MNILHLEDSPRDHLLVKKALASLGLQVSVARVDTLAEFATLIARSSYDIVIADYQLPGFTAIDAWNVVCGDNNHPPFVLFSGAIGEAAAVAAIKMGFSDYLAKDEVDKLGRVLQRAVAAHGQMREKEDADKALALSQKKLAQLTEHLQVAIERERALIARELHDEIGGALTAAKLDLAWIQRRTSTADVGEHAVSAMENVQLALEASKRIMLNLRPSILDEGLHAAIYWLAESFTKRTSIPVQLRLEKELLSLPADISLTAFRTIQEALTNISKYAQCNTVQIEVSTTEGVLTAEITDNGCGLSRDDLEKTQSFGLRGLKERAQHVGGWLDISSTPAQGTSIILSVPLSDTWKKLSDESFL